MGGREESRPVAIVRTTTKRGWNSDTDIGLLVGVIKRARQIVAIYAGYLMMMLA